MIKLNKEAFEFALKESEKFDNFINHGNKCLCGTFIIRLNPSQSIEMEVTCNCDNSSLFTLSKNAWLFIDDYADEWGCSQQIDEIQTSILRSKINKTICRGFISKGLYASIENSPCSNYAKC